ncbi:MAG: 50S ribosomal protein L18, partial [Bacteroidales bacterium]
MTLTKTNRRQRIRYRIRKKISGSGERPRMSVFRSNKQIYVQLVDDCTGNTLITASSREKDIASQKVSKVEQAIEFTADNGNCWVDLDNKAIVYVNSVPQAVNDTVTFDENNNI